DQLVFDGGKVPAVGRFRVAPTTDRRVAAALSGTRGTARFRVVPTASTGARSVLSGRRGTTGLRRERSEGEISPQRRGGGGRRRRRAALRGARRRPRPWSTSRPRSAATAGRPRPWPRGP